MSHAIASQSNAAACNRLATFMQLGNYQNAIHAFQYLKDVSGTEYRSAGRAYWGLGEFTQATIYLKKAIQFGDYGANVDLVQLAILQGEPDEAEQVINSIDINNLVPRDQVQLQFIKGDIAYRHGKMRLALNYLKKAWVEAKLLADSGSLIQAIGQGIAGAYFASGFCGKALEYLDQALQNAQGSWEVYLRMSRAEITFFLERYEESQDELNAVKNLVRDNPQLNIKYSINASLNEYFEQPQKAITTLLQAIHDCQKRSENQSLSTRAQFYLIGMFVHNQELDHARGQLCQLDLAVQSRGEHGLLELRRGQYQVAIGNLQPALQHLEAARIIFQDLEWRRELGWTLLQLANLHLKMGNVAVASQHLDLVSDVVHITENAGFLELERRFIGDLEPLTAIASSYGAFALHGRQAAARLPIEERPAARVLRLQAMGDATLLVNGQPTVVRLQKSLAMMAYLYLHPGTSLEKIVTDVFENSKGVEAGKSYFHTARYEIQAAIPSLRFAYDRSTKTYTLETDSVPLEFDYAEVARLLHAPTENDFYTALELCKGPFLRGFEGQWIEEVRANVEWLLVRSGLKLVQEMYETGDYQACRRLTERLLKVEPLDESLNELLVRATREVEGALASRKAMSMVESQFLAEVGELPPTLSQLKQELKYRMN